MKSTMENDERLHPSIEEGTKPLSVTNKTIFNGKNNSNQELEATEDNLKLPESLDFDTKHKSSSTDLFECPVCFNSVDSFPSITSCHLHQACLNCWTQYLRTEITESRVNLQCLQCPKPLHPHDIQQIVNPDLMIKYENFMLRRVLSKDPDTRWCPAPDCGYAVIASKSAICFKLDCKRPGCDTSFCHNCAQLWHPDLTCTVAAAGTSEFPLQSIIENDNGQVIKNCPRCYTLIAKDNGCNLVKCIACGTNFCWSCLEPQEGWNPYLHFITKCPLGEANLLQHVREDVEFTRDRFGLWAIPLIISFPFVFALFLVILFIASAIYSPFCIAQAINYELKRRNYHWMLRYLLAGIGSSVTFCYAWKFLEDAYVFCSPLLGLVGF